MSTSPTSLPGSGKIVQHIVSPSGEDEQSGEKTPVTPPSSPISDEPVQDNALSGGDFDMARGTTPGQMDVTLARETADGGSASYSKSENMVVHEDLPGYSKEKEQENVSQDLDKDIDAVLEYNVKNGQVDPNGSGNIQNITIDTTTDSIRRLDADGEMNSEIEPSFGDEKRNLEILPERIVPEVVSERSFTSDTDSSIFAESVVKSVLGKAIDIMRSEAQVESVMKQTVPEATSNNTTVGLFQYQDGGNHNEEEEEDYDDEEDDDINRENWKESEHVGKDQMDSIVGLFQYTDTCPMDRAMSPVVSEIEDVVEDQIESMDEEERSHILKLYGLEGVEPISPKLASTSESGTNSTDETGQRKVVDVQREVYEPSTRHFSVTRDTSSSESTPRLDEKGVNFKRLDIESNCDNIGRDGGIKISDNVIGDGTDNVAENESRDSDNSTELKSKDTNGEFREVEASMSHSISPPLIQYEPVKENGTFRIVKTAKAGGGAAYSTITVGSENLSPKGSLSPADSNKYSPRDLEMNGFETADFDRSIQKNLSESSAADFLMENVKQTPARQSDTSRDTVTEAEKERNYMTESGELDRDKIKKLIEKESLAAALRLSSSKDTSGSIDSGLPRSQYFERVDDIDRKSPRQLTMSELQATPTRATDISMESDLSRIRYTTRDTVGREVKRTGPKPFDMKDNRDTCRLVSDRDRLVSDSRYLQVHAQDRPGYDRDRYTSEDSHRTETKRGSSQSSSTYEEELLRSAYDRVSHQEPLKPQSAPAKSLARSPARSHDSSVIPGFTTLQDQQAKWSDMFHTLEDDHRRELRTQYERHQYNIQRLQQQMELELQKQHLAIRKKLDIHKEALVKMSPDRDSQRRYRSPGSIASPDQVQKSTDMSQRSPDRLRSERSTTVDIEDVSTLLNSFDTKTWREIYREVRGDEENSEASSRPLRRSLDTDFATTDSTIERGRPSGRRSSPRGSSDLSRSVSRDRSRDVTLDSSQRTPTNARVSKVERDRSLGKDAQRSFDRQRSPEGRDSRSFERETGSRSLESGRECVTALSPGDGAPQESVSRHVRELLDNLNDSRHSLQSLQDDITERHSDPRHSDPRHPDPRHSDPQHSDPQHSDPRHPDQRHSDPRHSDPQHSDTRHPDPQHSDPRHSDPRHSDPLGDVTNERPRAGVYSSPMPLLSRGRYSKATDQSWDTSVIVDSSRLTQSLPLSRDRAELHSERPRTTVGRDRMSESLRMHDSCLSPSSRMNLREKHSKHLADLRAYYEDELRELRKALSDTLDASTVSADTSMQSTVQGQLLDAENKHLLDKCRALDDEIEEMQMKVRSLEQKNHGLEKRSSEYAAAFTDAQTMSMQHRAHIEELQRYCRERDDLINDLESKMVSNDDSVKIYKKNFGEELELHRQDKISLQRMIDRYESLDREFKLLQETMNSTENKLYETRTDVVELNRTVSKLELENKRLGRENDNLRHKVTQSLNLTSLHESFGTPSSPREVQNCLKPRSPSHTQPDTSLNTSQQAVPDYRVPGFATSSKDWSFATQKSRPKSAGANRSRTDEADISKHTGVPKEKKESKSRNRDTGESGKGKQSEKSVGTSTRREDSMSSSREDVSVSFHRLQARQDVDERPTRDQPPPRRELTPPRSVTPSSLAGSDVSDYSPLLKAERELFKLRDMMRQAVAVKPSPPQPKLQKKFYGSERPSSKEVYNPDLGIARGRKEKPSVSNHSSVAKTKGNQTMKSDKSSSKRSSSVKSEKGSRSKEHGSRQETDKRERGKEKVEREMARSREKNPVGVEEVPDSSTRFDINFNEDDRTITLTPRKTDNQSGKQNNLCNGDAGNQSKEVKHGTSAAKGNISGADGHVENTLEMMRGGHYTSRPDWENIYTSLAKHKPVGQDRPRHMEEKVKDRLQSIVEMESRYDGLQVEKRQLESSITKIPLHGRVDRNNRRHKEEMENQLDEVERELGSLRMTLKRYNVLKTAG